jgi:hypothetical protein
MLLWLAYVCSQASSAIIVHFVHSHYGAVVYFASWSRVEVRACTEFQAAPLGSSAPRGVESLLPHIDVDVNLGKNERR